MSKNKQLSAVSAAALTMGASTMVFDEDLGAPLGVDGEELSVEALEEALKDVKVVPFQFVGVSYKVKIDLLKLNAGLNGGLRFAVRRVLKAAGYTDHDLENLGEEDENDPRDEKFNELILSDPRVLRQQAAIADAVFIAWNTGREKPTAEQFFALGGVYEAARNAIVSATRPTSAPSRAETPTTSEVSTTEPS